MFYFKFDIPKNEDGTPISYSPGWHGTMPRCPQNVKVLLYNDKEGYGIAMTEDEFMPPEAIKMTKKDALKAVDEVVAADGVFKGKDLEKRWDKKPIGEFHKGETCPYDGETLCQEGYCMNCAIKEKYDGR